MSPDIGRNSDLSLQQFTILCSSFIMHHKLIRFETSLIIVAMIELET